MIQQVAARVNLPVPAVVVTSTDQEVVQLLALANEEGQELATRYRWQALKAMATFTSVNQENQGSLVTHAPGFEWFFNGTWWDRAMDVPILPISDEEWARQKAYQITGPYYRYRIVDNDILFIPAPPAGHTIAFEYMHRNWCKSNAGVKQDEWKADTDVGILDEKLMILGIRWRWKQANGLDYGQDFAAYEARVQTAMSRDGGGVVLSLNGTTLWPEFIGPQSIPDGNWSI